MKDKKLTELEIMIRMIIGFLVIAGIILVINGYFIGVIVASLGLIAFAAGWKYFPPDDPLTVGAVTKWGRYLKTGHKPNGTEKDTRETIAVSGITILAPYFPFFIDAVRVDMTKENWEFSTEVVTKEKLDRQDGHQKARSVSMKCKILMTVQPDCRHLNSYAQSGSDLKKIKDLMGGIPNRELQKLVRETKTIGDDDLPGLSYFEVNLYTDQIGKELESLMNGTPERKGVFEEKSFGTVCTKVQIIPEIPQRIKDDMEDAASIEYETAARALEYEGVIKASEEFGNRLNIPGNEAFEKVIESRLVRDRGVKRIQIEGKGATTGGIVLSNVNFNEEKSDKKKG